MSMKQIHARKIKDRITMLRPKLPIKNMYWEFHKNDDDYWPSVPHGHSLDGNYKLEIWSGNIYNLHTGKLAYKAKQKEMNKLQQYEDFQDFVSICREEYAKRNPSITIPELKIKRRRSSHRVEHKKVQEKYLFKISANRI